MKNISPAAMYGVDFEHEYGEGIGETIWECSKAMIKNEYPPYSLLSRIIDDISQPSEGRHSFVQCSHLLGRCFDIARNTQYEGSKKMRTIDRRFSEMGEEKRIIKFQNNVTHLSLNAAKNKILVLEYLPFALNGLVNSMYYSR